MSATGSTANAFILAFTTRTAPDGDGASASVHLLLGADDDDLEFMKDIDHIVWLEMIEAEPCGRGAGGAALRALTGAADAAGIVLGLSVVACEAPGALGETKLTAWYERHGFAVASPGIHVRQPARAA